MTIPKDFRYILDGVEIEAIQITQESRYAQKQWPEWLDSRMLVSYEHGEQRLVIGNNEQVIPELGWIVRTPGGSLETVDAFRMEEATKVVQEQPDQHPRADANISDVDLAKAHGIELPPGHVDERETVVKFEPPELTGAVELATTMPAEADRGLLFETRAAFQMLCDGDTSGATDKLRDALLERCNWCDCAPGRCDGAADMWDCRRNSPLAQ